MNKERLKLPDSFMAHFRWITPLLLAVSTAVLGVIWSEIKDIRKEYVRYTDKIVQMATERPHSESVTRNEFKEFQHEIRGDLSDIKTLLQRKNGR